MTHYPLIGITAYERTVHQHPLIRMSGTPTLYHEAVVAAGGLPVLIPQSLDNDQIDAIFGRLDGILLPGGGDINPDRYQQPRHATTALIDDQRDAFEIQLAQRALDDDMPLLAICRGHQILNTALGGTLYQNVETQLPNAGEHEFFSKGTAWEVTPHTVRIAPNSKLAELLGTLEIAVNSFHHQSIQTVGAGLQVSAYAPDESIEAVELPGHRFALGVQWHPEGIVDVVPEMRGLFRGLVEAV